MPQRQDRPVVLPRVLREHGIRIHDDPVAHQGEQRDVVARVGVGPAVGELRAALVGERLGDLGLVLGVQHVPDQLAGEDAVDRLDLRAEGARQARGAGRSPRRPAAGVAEISHTSWPLARCSLVRSTVSGPELAFDVALVDVLGEGPEVLLGVPGDELQSPLLRGGQVLAVLADLHEAEVVPGEQQDVADRDETPPERTATDVVHARPAHQRVVDIEERDDRAIARGLCCVGHRGA